MSDMYSRQLKLYSELEASSVEWLWYPYIPFGKITLLEGDPGCGKSTLISNIIGAVSSGKPTPDGNKLRRPLHVIYQCSEDGASDTIKPRLINAGADCDNVAFINEDIDVLTLNDEKLRRAIADFNAKLVVADPFQAYLGSSDLSNVMQMRKTLKKLAMWAAAYDCAVVLIGHLNKKQGRHDLYRGLGSIDLSAQARSVLLVETIDESDTRVLKHIKSSLSKIGDSLYFTIDSDSRVIWLDSEAASGMGLLPQDEKSKQLRAAEMLRSILSDGPVRAAEIREIFEDKGIGERTLLIVKKEIGIKSFRQNGLWYWTMPIKQAMGDTPHE